MGSAMLPVAGVDADSVRAGRAARGYFQGLADRAMGRRQFTPEEFREFCDAHDNYWV